MKSVVEPILAIDSPSKSKFEGIIELWRWQGKGMVMAFQVFKNFQPNFSWFQTHLMKILQVRLLWTCICGTHLNSWCVDPSWNHSYFWIVWSHDKVQWIMAKRGCSSTFTILIFMAVELLDLANEWPWWVTIAISFVFAFSRNPKWIGFMYVPFTNLFSINFFLKT